LVKRVVGTLGLIALGAIGLGLATGFAQANPASPRAASATTHITVAASEFKFVFSKRSIPAVGTVIFTVVNKGKISHDFKIGGKKTANLLPGKSAKLTVKFTKKGHYAYLCTLPGHAGAGMKGTFSVGVAAVKPPPVTTTPTTTTQPTTTTTSTVPVGTAKTTVTVNMVEYAFQLSQSTIPSGQITFVINNKGNEVHNFAILGNKAGAQIAPGTSETWTVSLPPGTYNYQCDVPFHASNGMVGQFTVTP
jgi:uncharacterized cupredoxin-like copper-binding protein